MPQKFHAAFNPIIFEVEREGAETEAILNIYDINDVLIATMNRTFFTSTTKIDVSTVINKLFSREEPVLTDVAVDNRLFVRYKVDNVLYIAINAAVNFGQTSSLNSLAGFILSGFTDFKVFDGYPFDVSALIETYQMYVKHGRHYNFMAVIDERGIAPVGWHVPTIAELTTLKDYATNNPGGSLSSAKALASIGGWTYSESLLAPGTDPEINDSLGFSAMPSGYIKGNISSAMGQMTAFHSSDWNPVTGINEFQIAYSYPLFGNATAFLPDEHTGLSVRCIRDAENESETATDYDGNVYQSVTIGTQTWLTTNLATAHYNNGDSILNDLNSDFGAYSDYNDDLTLVFYNGAIPRLENDSISRVVDALTFFNVNNYGSFLCDNNGDILLDNDGQPITLLGGLTINFYDAPVAPFYIKFVNKMGGVEYWMFSYNQEVKTSVKSSASYRKFYTDSEAEKGSQITYSKDTEDFVIAGAEGLTVSEYNILSLVGDSPDIQWFNETTQKWVAVTIEQSENSRNTRSKRCSVEFKFILPKRNTQF